MMTYYFKSQANFTNLMSNISPSGNSSMNFLTKVDHVTGKTLWAYTYQYTNGANVFLLVYYTLKNENIWIVLTTSKHYHLRIFKRKVLK